MAFNYLTRSKNKRNYSVNRIIGQSYDPDSHLNHQFFRRACHQPGTLCSQDFVEISEMKSFDFSKNGDFFISGLREGTVALWRTVQFLGNIENPKPIIMKSLKPARFIRNVTTSPNDRTIFSNKLTEISLHDVQT